ncbi:MAG TPA: hypothetical protein VMG41_12240 [Gemmatimonadales bacterium]|nr:hypothetical protein [Gemmatimonadales bacterium]
MDRQLVNDTGRWLSPRRSRARVTLFGFLLTFTCARIVTFLIMAHRLPDVYLHVGGTHVHHLNYGIFLLSGVGAYLLFASHPERRLRGAALVYGVGLGLTFDEFGMWLHLGGPYWQRASFDAVIVLGALLAFIAYMPPFTAWRPRHIRAVFLLLPVVALFYHLLAESFRFAARVAPHFERLENQGPP